MYLHEELTNKIIRCYYNVYNEFGYGFLEKVYENAMIFELQSNGLNATQQAPIKVFYKDRQVGSYFADILVDNICILELKAGEGGIVLEHELQLTNYLKATEYEIGLLLFFGEKPSFKRKVFTNEHKQIR